MLWRSIERQDTLAPVRRAELRSEHFEIAPFAILPLMEALL